MTTASPPPAAADRGEEDTPERGAEQAVNDEVTGRVDDDKQIAQLGVVEMEATTQALRGREQHPEDLIEQRRSLADDEDADDDHDAQRDVVLLAMSSTVSAVNLADVR